MQGRAAALVIQIESRSEEGKSGHALRLADKR